MARAGRNSTRGSLPFVDGPRPSIDNSRWWAGERNPLIHEDRNGKPRAKHSPGDPLQALKSVAIRPLADADCAGILSINAGNRPAVAALDRAELERLRGLSDMHLVAVAGDGALIAYMLVFADRCAYDGEEFQYFRAHLSPPFLYVDQVAVDPRRTRSGVGTRLYGELLELAAARRIGALCCEVNTSPPNPASLEFHRRLGFTAIGNGDTLDRRRVTFLVRNV